VRRSAVCNIERAPMISSVRRYGSPCAVMCPSRVLPPVEYCLGVSPSQVRELPAIAELVRVRDARHEGRSADRTHAAQGLNALGAFIAARMLFELALICADAFIQKVHMRKQLPQCFCRPDGQLLERRRRAAPNLHRPLWQHHAELGE